MEIEKILAEAIKYHCSDIHISPRLPPIIRVDGDLIPLKEFPALTPEDTKQLIYSVFSKLQQEEFEKELEIDLAYEVKSFARFRIHAFYQAYGISAAFRMIPTSVPTLDELDMPQVFKQLLSLPNGLILVTGPTGSGKSTTLAAMVDYINTHQACHIISIEDPIEFLHSSKKSLISQRQVLRDTRSFDVALRSALREDPDVILLGEMRDLETIRLALTAAETGHLVMATLHTSSAPRAVSRIIDVFEAHEKNIIRNILSESLQAVLCQTLVKKNSGGRVPAFEIMLGTNAVRNLIREDKIAQMYSVIQTNGSLGMCTVEQYLQSLIERKIISPQITGPGMGSSSAIHFF